MVKKLTKYGNSLTLVIDKPILDLFRWDANTEFDVSPDGQGGLHLKPLTKDQTADRAAEKKKAAK